MEKLKSCSRCGSEALIRCEYCLPRITMTGVLIYTPICSNKNCINHIAHGHFISQNEAIEHWNGRNI